MIYHQQCATSNSSTRLRTITKLFCAAIFATTIWAEAQTFTVLHNFSGPEGTSPEAGLTMDQAGNLYGTTYSGGNTVGNCQFTDGCGVVFNMIRHGSNWALTPIYKFSGADGSNPAARVIIAVGTTGFLRTASAVPHVLPLSVSS